MIIGQDWGDVKYFKDCIKDNEGLDDDSNPTCKNLMELLSKIDYKIDVPSKSKDRKKDNNSGLFFTNAILCLKPEKEKKQGKQGKQARKEMQGKIKKEWCDNCREFLAELIKIVEPKTIIALGLIAYNSVLKIYDIAGAISVKQVVKEKKKKNDAILDNTVKTKVFLVYHCGARTVNRYRKMDKMKEDWEFIYSCMG